MLLYLLKRLLLLLPTLWLVCTVMFVFSRLIPGHYDIIIPDSEPIQRNIANEEARRKAYEQFLRKNGLDLPLFYVSLKTLAEPDTLYKVWQENERDFLKRMLFYYGNWADITNYYHQLQSLQISAQKLIIDSHDKLTFQNQIVVFFLNIEEEKIYQNFIKLHRVAATINASPLLTDKIDKTEKAYQSVKQHSTFYKNLVPVIHWYGLENQYHQWFIKVLHGDFGISFRDARPVTSMLVEAINNTLLLSIATLLLIFSLAFVINIFIANEGNKWWRSPILNFLYTLDTIPTFLLALLLLIFLAGTDFIHLFPIYGLGEVSSEASWFQQLSIRLHYLVIPVVCLTASNIAYVTSQVFHAMREVQHMDFITTARAKGLPETVVVKKHILRIALLPAITLFTGFLPAIIGGALVIEVIFAIPGTGRLLVDAVLARDYPVILGIVLVIAFVKIFAHILADLLYYLADPRIRF